MTTPGFFFYRVFSMVLATLLGIVVLAFSAQSTDASQRALFQTFLYSNFGIAAGVITVISVPLMLLRDCISASGTPVVFELLWLTKIWILFVITGALTLKQANFSIVGTCDVFDGSPDIQTVCRVSQPIALFSFGTAVIVFLYTFSLLCVACAASSRGKSIWTASIKNRTTSESKV